MTSPASSKQELRRRMRALLRGVATDPRPVCAAFDRWLRGHPGIRTVAVYAALPGEPDLSGLVARHPAVRWVYPRIGGADLTFHEIQDPQAGLEPGAFGIAEPSRTSPAVPVAEIDAFACPGLAFDRTGGRLGRGRGFYDRLLATARPDAVKLGVCFADQIVPDTFSEPHDIRMDRLISG